MEGWKQLELATLRVLFAKKKKGGEEEELVDRKNGEPGNHVES